MLNQIECPKCKRPMEHFDVVVRKVNKFHDCSRRCEICGIGASNAKRTPTFIYKDYKDNIPTSLHDGLDYTLDHSLNTYNRENKKTKIGYSTSEDALTWTFFKYLSTSKYLPTLQSILGLEFSINEILLWGVPLLQREQSRLVDELKKSCEQYDRDHRKLSEPDCVVITQKEVMFIEVKLNSDNPIEKDTKKFLKYANPNFYSDYEKATSTGLYELIRNWTIGKEFSKDRKFSLMNLGKKSLFSDTNKKRNLDSFKEALSTPDRFLLKDWESIIESPEFQSFDSWFIKDVRQRLYPFGSIIS